MPPSRKVTKSNLGPSGPLFLLISVGDLNWLFKIPYISLKQISELK